MLFFSAPFATRAQQPNEPEIKPGAPPPIHEIGGGIFELGKIRIDKNGSASTILWNPWTAKAQQMPDFGNEEFKQMICIESGNVAKNRISLAPGRTAVLKVTLSSTPL